jgi:hypothetical protein
LWSAEGDQVTRPVAIVVFIAALVVPWAVLLGTNAVMGEPPGGHLADLLDLTYRDANALLFFVLWPAVTVILLGWVCCNGAVARSG